MTLTMEQALTADRFHFTRDNCHVTYGKTGRAKPVLHAATWRRNGKTKTWKTRPGAYRIPVKYGLRAYDYITEHDDIHVASECPAAREIEAWWVQHLTPSRPWTDDPDER